MKHTRILKTVLLFIILSLGIVFYVQAYARMTTPVHVIPVRSVDTMKYSRDVAREKIADPLYDDVIERQINQIARVGATHVSISTPYDEEFFPFLKRWVTVARKHSLKVWFRGNLSGWEGWFGYPEISPEEHTKQIEKFIINHADIFQNGDIFTSCPECENGGPGDPRYGDVKDYRKFLIHEYQVTKSAFAKLDKNVTTNYYSMNGDVAKLVMDKATVKALDGVITVDHYVGTPDTMIQDIREYARRGAGKIVLGETGAPIPDIHGDMTEEEQAKWLAEFFTKLYSTPEVIGINYWVNEGGSTALWDANGTPRKGVLILKNFYNNEKVTGKVTNDKKMPLAKAVITVNNKTILPSKNGTFTIPYLMDSQEIKVSAPGYKTTIVTMDKNKKLQTIVLAKEGNTDADQDTSWLSRLINLFTSPFNL